MKARLILVCGLPGSGKTTLSTKLAAEIPAVRVCPDDWLRRLNVDLFNGEFRDLLEKCLWEHSKELLALGQSVILEFGFWSRSERDEKREWARLNDIEVELRSLNLSTTELLRRVQARYAKDNTIEALTTLEHMEEWSRSFQAPDASEIELFDNPKPAIL